MKALVRVYRWFAVRLGVEDWVESRRLWRNPEWRRQIAQSEADWEHEGEQWIADRAVQLEADPLNHADEDIASHLPDDEQALIKRYEQALADLDEAVRCSGLGV